MSHRERPEQLPSLPQIGKLLALAKDAGYDLDSHELDTLTIRELEELVAQQNAAKSLKN